MKKVLLIRTVFLPWGGASAATAWIIEALKKDYSVTLLTWKPVDLEEINRFYGTSLKNSEPVVHCINPVLRGLMSLVPDLWSFQKESYTLRVCKRLRNEYDVIISADNEAEFGRRGIQYFHYPHMHKQIRPGIDLPWYRKLGGILKGHYLPWMFVSGFSYDRMKDNLTLVNSDWTGSKVREFYGIETKTVYPPIPGLFPEVPWEEKENGFVCIGRITREKKLENIIDILSSVRSQGQNIHLHIIGRPGNNPDQRKYYQQVAQRVQENASWIFLNKNLSREDLVKLVSRHRYGIHAKPDEHFGIAVAEMVKAGCITFIPNNGGQVEIVGGDERMIYQTKEEAVTKILRVINNPYEQTLLRNYLRSRKELFSTDQFIHCIQEIIRKF
jgi:glycosyltransferase involved in cell wall biosynthesis